MKIVQISIKSIACK